MTADILTGIMIALLAMGIHSTIKAMLYSGSTQERLDRYGKR